MLQIYLRNFFKIGPVHSDERSDCETHVKSSQESVDESSFESDDAEKQLLFYVDPKQKNKLVVMPQGQAYESDEVVMIFSKLIQHGQQSPDSKIAVEATEAVVSLFSPYIEDMEEKEQKKGAKKAKKQAKEQDKKPKAWINERVVDRWFDILSQTYKDKKVANIHSWYKQSYIKDLGVAGSRFKDRQRLREAELIFWPIQEGNHWYLLIIEKKNNCFMLSCLDGFNLREMHFRFLNVGESLVKTLFNIKDLKIYKKSIHVPEQDNGDDCALVPCLFGERVCQGRPLEGVGSCDYKQVRLYVAEKLASLTPQVYLNGYIVQGQRRRLVALGANDSKKQAPVPEDIIDLTKDAQEQTSPKKQKKVR
jgi:hypothetical protein